MALIKCPECGKEISDKIKSCIHCGCKIKHHFKKISIIIIIGALSVLCIGLIFVFSSYFYV
ncbi:MAG: zinc-ribbon domain-containing protein, partial [Oscillospiraceae bacterium]